MDQDYSVTSNLNADYVFDGTYGPIPDENGFVDLTDYAKNYIADYENVTEIPAENMKYLNACIPNNMTRTFAGLVKCSTIDVSGMDTSHVSSFSNCFNQYRLSDKQDDGILSNIIGIERLNTSSATNMESMFAYTKITDLDLSKWDVSNVTNMNSMFSNMICKSLNIDNWSTKLVKQISGFLNGITANTESGNTEYCTICGIENLNLYNCIDLSYFFGNGHMQSNLNNGNFDLSKWDVSNVTNIEHFKAVNIGYGNTNFNIINIENWNTSNFINMSGMFQLTTFKNYPKQTLDLSKWDVSNVKYIDDMFNMANCNDNSLTTIIIDGWNFHKVSSINNIFNIDDINISAKNINLDGVTTANYAFSGSHNVDLTGVKNYNSITDMRHIFSDCTDIIVDMDLINNQLVDIAFAFNNANITNCKIKNAKPSTMDSTFEYATSTLPLDLSTWDTSNCTSYRNLFFSSTIRTIYFTMDMKLIKPSLENSELDIVNSGYWVCFKFKTSGESMYNFLTTPIKIRNIVSDYGVSCDTSNSPDIMEITHDLFQHTALGSYFDFETTYEGEVFVRI